MFETYMVNIVNPPLRSYLPLKQNLRGQGFDLNLPETIPEKNRF